MEATCDSEPTVVGGASARRHAGYDSDMHLCLSATGVRSVWLTGGTTAQQQQQHWRCGGSCVAIPGLYARRWPRRKTDLREAKLVVFEGRSRDVADRRDVWNALSAVRGQGLQLGAEGEWCASKSCSCYRDTLEDYLLEHFLAVMRSSGDTARPSMPKQALKEARESQEIKIGGQCSCCHTHRSTRRVIAEKEKRRAGLTV
ncbi:hypothetical protein K438DRAFT_1872000 [Mycena galopus ATCC 62051]|nr:hypothetical protein K438DRAFT_1872000 [Mycena galopus ATCC 62051]